MSWDLFKIPPILRTATSIPEVASLLSIEGMQSFPIGSEQHKPTVTSTKPRFYANTSGTAGQKQQSWTPQVKYTSWTNGVPTVQNSNLQGAGAAPHSHVKTTQVFRSSGVPTRTLNWPEMKPPQNTFANVKAPALSGGSVPVERKNQCAQHHGTMRSLSPLRCARAPGPEMDVTPVRLHPETAPSLNSAALQHISFADQNQNDWQVPKSESTLSSASTEPPRPRGQNGRAELAGGDHIIAGAGVQHGPIIISARSIQSEPVQDESNPATCASAPVQHETNDAFFASALDGDYCINTPSCDENSVPTPSAMVDSSQPEPAVPRREPELEASLGSCCSGLPVCDTSYSLGSSQIEQVSQFEAAAQLRIQELEARIPDLERANMKLERQLHEDGRHFLEALVSLENEIEELTKQNRKLFEERDLLTNEVASREDQINMFRNRMEITDQKLRLADMENTVLKAELHMLRQSAVAVAASAASVASAASAADV